MCEIGKRIEIIDSQPLVLPAPLRNWLDAQARTGNL